MKKLDMVIVKDRAWTKTSLRELLERNDKAVIKALKLLYSFQTIEEQSNEKTIEANGKGFNSVDSEILSSFADRLIQGKGLSKNQLAIARKRILKYSGQIFEYMKERG